MPRRTADNGEAPRRRRGAKAVALEAESERGFLMRILLHSPKDTAAGALAFAGVSAIIINALFLQAGHHPAPMFGGSVTPMPTAPVAANPAPRPRPAETDPSAPEPRLEPKPVDSRAAEPRTADPMTNLVKATIASPMQQSNVVRPPAPIPMPAHLAGQRRVAAVQRALTEYGYGQLKPTGSLGLETQTAIQKFEREHKMPVTGQISDRLVRELALMIGHPIE